MTRRSIAATALGPFLLLVAALAAPATQAGGGCHGNDGSAYTEGDGNTVIRMDVCSFSPTINRVPIGATVRFLNTSNVEHAVVGRAGTWGSAILPVGTEFSETFDGGRDVPVLVSAASGDGRGDRRRWGSGRTGRDRRI